MRRIMAVIATVLMVTGLAACHDGEIRLKSYPASRSGNCRDGYTVQYNKRKTPGITLVILKDGSKRHALWMIEAKDATKYTHEVTVGKTPPGYTVIVPWTADALRQAASLEVSGKDVGTTVFPIKCS